MKAVFCKVGNLERTEIDLELTKVTHTKAMSREWWRSGRARSKRTTPTSTTLTSQEPESEKNACDTAVETNYAGLFDLVSVHDFINADNSL